MRTNVAIQAIIQSKLKQVSTCDVSGGSQPGEQRDATDVKQTSDDTVSAQWHFLAKSACVCTYTDVVYMTCTMNKYMYLYEIWANPHSERETIKNY